MEAQIKANSVLETKELTQELVKYLFDYKDGQLIRRVKIGSFFVKIGDIAGSINKAKSGYRYVVRINNKSYYLARVIFLWHHGWLPEIVDHIDRNALNNRIENLRASDKNGNSRNRSSSKNSNSKHLGVHFYTTKKTSFSKKENKMKTYYSSGWTCSITLNKNKIYLGSFKTEKEAAIAYNEAAKKHYGEFANLNIIED